MLYRLHLTPLVQELLEGGANPNLCSEATGITLLHQVIDTLNVFGIS